jgi:hypothetical protein
MHVIWDDQTRKLVEEVRSFVKDEVPADLLRRTGDGACPGPPRWPRWRK